MYVIMKGDQFVSYNPGITGSSYTKLLQLAKVFNTQEEAEREWCPQNEMIVSLESIFMWRE